MSHLLGHAAAELPAHACLDSECDVVHIDLPGMASMLGVDTRVSEDLGRVAVRKLEQLVDYAGLDVLDGRCGREEERDGPRGGGQIVCGARHGGRLVAGREVRAQR